MHVRAGATLQPPSWAPPSKCGNLGYHTMLEPSCTTSHKSIHPDIMMFTDHFASVLSNFHKMIGTADLEKKRIFEPKNDPGRG